MHPSLKIELATKALGALQEIRVEAETPEQQLSLEHQSLREITTSATPVETPTTPEEIRQMGLAEARAYLLDLQRRQQKTPIEKPQPALKVAPKSPKRLRWQETQPEESESWLGMIENKALKRFEKRYSRNAARHDIYDAA